MTADARVRGERAGSVTRFGALAADAIILWVALRGAVSFLLLAEHALRRFAPPFSLAKLLFLSAPVIVILYNVVFWWLRGQTPGKWLLGLRVVALGGGKVGLGRAVIRFVGYLFSALPFYLGFLWILGPERRGFHDRLAGTEVIYTRRLTRKLPTPSDRRLVPRRYSAV
jgi:uncharacterized RDD family membrane protein YckC